MAVNQELKSIIKTIKFREGVTQDVIAAKLGVQPTYLSDAINGRVVFSYALRERIYEQYSYTKSEGEMLADDTIEVDGIPKEGEQNSDVIYSIPFIDKAMATAPDINIRKLVQEKAHTLEEFPFYKMVKDVDYIQTVITMAMAPRYLPGDFLFIRFRDGQVLSGKIYLVDTNTYGTMLRLVYIEEGGYVLKAFNPAFKSVFVKSEDVYSISSVVLSVNTNTSLTSDVDLASLVKSRDAQIMSLQKTQDAFIEQQQSLIDEIRKQNDRLDKERERTDKLIEKIINQ